MSTTAISIRLDSDIKKEFDSLCKEFGISTNAAFNLFARTVVREKSIPFPISVNKEQRSIDAQKALEQIQALSVLEEHEWTDEEIDNLIRAHRLSKKKQ